MKQNHIYNSVERLGDLLKVGARQAGAEHGLQPVHVEVLHYLSICNRYSDTPMAVTDYLGLTKGTVSQTLKVLEKKDLLVKSIDENDKRITHLKLSESGQKLVADLLPTSLFMNACAQLSPEQQSNIDSSLKLLLRALLTANNLKTFGVCKTCRYNQQTSDGNYFCGLVKQPLTSDDTQLICREHEDI
ncbi:MarR family winged helix-turn-helix transcriptional regulator [Pseudoalteromonas sp. T1lg23B]|uniref:MarR family winged helix-turn-helix transcriptional regulator n=1 Tax=Pseudoalteromonas sp. T1lg23B TaxID=2077097 RepID=UPI000CF6C674|nr:MarR family winged helix-turn-helix transcriptional regulator [Pseudoalteromonas sp. T1lg23B]